ncbi:hypothetical protein EC9_50800 [Rosistilla ulvae]|uniref:Uncharacterized protein n=1 Tax=Rosistilla ulvae TaxID=1930277 RepID=A0A517M7J6_9BACT|nr:hypothetical protein EC9_50800 [Rosistilla ulvae]
MASDEQGKSVFQFAAPVGTRQRPVPLKNAALARAFVHSPEPQHFISPCLDEVRVKESTTIPGTITLGGSSRQNG